MSAYRRWLALLLIAGSVLRLAYSLGAAPAVGYDDRGGDSGWYLLNGLALLGGELPEGMTVDISTLQPPPGYLIFVGLPQLALPLPAAVDAIRVAQALLSAASAYLAAGIAARVGGQRAGLIACALLALGPVFILDSGQITTETLYLFLLTAALASYLQGAVTDRPRLGWLVVAGVLFGLATLTRAVLLLFPLGLVVHLALVYRPRWLLPAAMLIATYALTVSIWSVYNLARWDRLVIAGDGFAGFLYAGSVGWSSPETFDQQLATDAAAGTANTDNPYLDAAANVISRDVSGYVTHRVTELVEAYLQPHGTTWFSGESLRVLLLAWLRDDRSLAGLRTLIEGDAFFPKLVFYLYHYGVLFLGVLGAWVTRRHWRSTLPLLGFAAYVTLAHLILYALPRYLFPTLVVWAVFAAVWLAQVSERGRRAAHDLAAEGMS